jgi:hypothetical protein
MDGSAREAGMRPWRGIVGGLVAVLLAASVGSDGTVRLDLVFRDQADAGGGLSYAQAVIQLCVTVTATPGPDGEVRLDDPACLSGGSNEECVGG